MKKKTTGTYASPWAITGAAAILLAVLVAMAAANYNREKRYMAQILLEKGSALIKSFEAGTRTGMRAMGWGERQVQYLMEELADQSDVLYITVTDTKGEILAHSRPEKIGGRFEPARQQDAAESPEKEKWRLTETEQGLPAFEVYREFNPYSRDPAGRHMAGHGRRRHMADTMGGWCAPDNYDSRKHLIFIGFDRTPFIEARHQDFRITAVISSIVVVLGFAGFTSMMVLNRYRSTRRRLQDTSAIADEVISGLPAGLIVTDSSGALILVNPAAESITGLSGKNILGRPAGEVLPEPLAEQLMTGQNDTRVTERELECSFAGKSAIPLSVSSARIINEEDVLVGSLVIFRDLSEIKELRRQMQRKEKLAAIGGLAAGIAHEIRNPLSSVKGMATYFKNRFTDDEDARQAAGVMVQETDRLNRVINELLEFARPSRINARPCDINDVLEHSIRLIRQEAEDHGVTVEFRAEKDIPRAVMDPDRFVQCLLNLYLNSIQAMEQGGMITVETGILDEQTVFIRVSDTGPGIAEDDRDRIFDPYYTTKPGGTGLGLAIVHNIIEEHGGRITVTSTPAQGTAFTVYLSASKKDDPLEARQ